MTDWQLFANPALMQHLAVGVALTQLGPPAIRHTIGYASGLASSSAPWEPIAARLPAHLELEAPQRRRLKRQIKRFITHKQWIGCAGLEITPEIQLGVAAPACLLQLGGFEALPYRKVRYIHVYPSEFTASHRWRAGEAPPSQRRARWRGAGRYVPLAWNQRTQCITDFNDGQNPALWELQSLTQQRRNGDPLLRSAGAFGTWALMLARHQRLDKHPIFGRSALLTQYGVDRAAVLFAAAVEGLFSGTDSFAHEHPELFSAAANHLGFDR